MKSKLIRTIRTEKILVTFLLVVLISSLSVGFAIFQSDLSVTSDVTFLGVTDHNGTFEMTDFNCVNTAYAEGYSYGINRNETPNGVNMVANLRVVYTGGPSPFAAYYADFYNDTNDYYTYDGFDGGAWFNGITSKTPKVLNKNRGDYIKPGEKFSLLLVYFYEGDVPNWTDTWTSATFKFLKGQQAVSRGTYISNVTTKKYMVNGDETIFRNQIIVSNNYDVSMGYDIYSMNPNVIICDEYGNEDTFYYSVNKSETSTREFYMKLTSPITDESVSTEVYIQLDDGTVIKSGVVLFTKDEEEVVIPDLDTIEDAKGEMEVNAHASWADHFDGTITVTNSGKTTLSNFTVVVKFKDGFNLQDTGCWGPNGYPTTFNTSTNTMKIQSNYMWGSQGDIVIPPGGSRDFTGIMVNILNTNGYSDIIEYVTVVEGLVANE